ncbi:sigma-54-dependent Fis family transcriptional regulator [Bacteroides finegoldii]|nr:sigma-54-dependent Fis family transcriptional regulator [Bacteroides finegoldii]
MKPRILIVEDNVVLSQLQKKWLERYGYDVLTAMNEPIARKLIRNQTFDLIFSDVRLPEGNGISLLKWLNKFKIRIPFVIMTDYASFSDAVYAVKLGAKDYLPKPVHKERLHELVCELLKPLLIMSEEKRIIRRTSLKAKEVERLALLTAPSDISVMIFGANGTGKESVAQCIHLNSERHDQPFIAVNCGGIPRDLASSYFFGHVKGAFTGAESDRKGYFELANGGTLFLDEIGNMPFDLQTMLLRVLQERTYSPVGSHKELFADVRILSATNEDLKQAISNGLFREDLYHRLCEFELYMPTLSECPEDILAFADFFREQFSKRYRREITGFTVGAKDMLLGYSWSGNIRELRNRIKRAVIVAQYGLLSEEDLGFNEEIITNFSKKSQTTILKLKDEKRELDLVKLALEKSGGNITQAAILLGISRQALYARLRKCNIK